MLCFRLDEISGAASKEFGLEKAMEKMKVEWKDMYFEFIPYRDTVSAVDMDLSRVLYSGVRVCGPTRQSNARKVLGGVVKLHVYIPIVKSSACQRYSILIGQLERKPSKCRQNVVTVITN